METTKIDVEHVKLCMHIKAVKKFKIQTWMFLIMHVWVIREIHTIKKILHGNVCIPDWQTNDYKRYCLTSIWARYEESKYSALIVWMTFSGLIWNTSKVKL